jgi:hypothetical protein
MQDWVALGSVDLDEAADQQLEEVGDWECNFKALKTVARDAEKLPNEICVDCYRISLLPVKQTVDEHMKRLQEALVASLRRKVCNGTLQLVLHRTQHLPSVTVHTPACIHVGSPRHAWLQQWARYLQRASLDTLIAVLRICPIVKLCEQQVPNPHHIWQCAQCCMLGT